MTIKQKFLKAVYPAFINLTKLTGKNIKILNNEKGEKPVSSIYDLNFESNTGAAFPLSKFRGKKMLLVNTASNCGYTPQYEELQELYVHSGDKVVVLGFPANDFRQQEQGSDKEIHTFCTINFGATFPLAKKSVVVKNAEQNKIFQWLTDSRKNGWNTQPPTWNFSKYLVNEQGVLTHYFDPSVSPLNAEVMNAING
jgi:glutathione peroxidase